MQQEHLPPPGHGGALGHVVSEWRAGWALRIALTIVVLIFPGMFIGIGVALNELPMLIAASVATTALLFLLHFQQSGVRVVVYSKGIEYRGRGGTKRLAWDQVHAYQLNITDPVVIMGAAGGALGALVVLVATRVMAKKHGTDLKPQSVVLSGPDGAKLTLSAGIKNYRELLDHVVPRLTERLFIPALRTFENGGIVQFGKKLALQKGVGITFTGAIGRPQILRFDELGGATIERSQLVIRRKDTGEPWQRVVAAAVPSPRVFEKLCTLQRTPEGPPTPEALPLGWTV